MKGILVPLYFQSGRDEAFEEHLATARELLKDDADILEPVALGSALPDADAVIFPQLLGDVFKQFGEIRKINLPFLVLTSEFGTVAMWDWEIVSYFKAEGKNIFTPYTLEQAKSICRSLAIKRDLKRSTFLTYLDNPGDGFQAEIFKRFYWWEQSCTDGLKDKFGLTVKHESFKELGAKAKQVEDAVVDELLVKWNLNATNVNQTVQRKAAKVYVVLKEALEKDDTIRAIGINCLNESHFSDTVPCLAWSQLYEEKGLIWGCEGDTMSMTLKYLINKCIGADVIMSNLYPFLVGDPALKHERIDSFPEVDSEPENHILIVHCGYFGLVPRKMASQWEMQPKVLSIVDDHAHALDARLPEGKMTLAKMDLEFKRLQIVEGELIDYVQFPNSDCLNGGVMKIKDGHQLMNEFHSHHYLVVVGHHRPEFINLAKVFGLQLQVL